MASRTMEASSRPSFAKVAASAYVPPKLKDSTSNTKPPADSAEATSIPKEDSGLATNSDSKKPPIASIILNQHNKIITNNESHMPPTSAENLQARDQQLKADVKTAEGSRQAHALLKATHGDDSSTQLSSDSSVKPPSLDGKSITSGTTFALDEKESLRPDDSASVKATDEGDIFSPPDSIPPDSRVGSDRGNRAFHDQLYEIASMDPAPDREAPVLKSGQPTGQSHGPAILFNPSAVQSQPPPLQSPNPSIVPPEVADPIPDEKLLEAVESPRDRLFVMKLEQDFIDFVKDKQERSLELPQCNGFYRMLAHRLADYYLLGHTLDNSINAVRIYRTPFCRIPRPLTGPSNPSTSANTPPPSMMAPKIMRRGDVDQKRTDSNETKPEDPGKVASNGEGDSGPEKDPKPKVPRTREEKEIAYKQAKERIFGPEHSINDTVDKANAVEEKDNSRSSSVTGKKKAKSKQRKNSDDGFELRSQYEPYYPSSFSINGFGAGGDSGYNAYPAFNTISQQSSPTGNMQSFPYTPGYPAMVQQAPAGQTLWQGQHLPNFNPGQDSQSYGAMQDNTFNLDSAFQQMSFQPPGGYPSQPTSNYGPSYQDTFQDMSRSASQQQQPGAWSQMSYQSPSQAGQAPFFPSQVPYVGQISQTQNPYPYGQLPQGFANGKSSQNQHPVPGSFNRQQFNPQSQAFVPHYMASNTPQYMIPQMGSPPLSNFATSMPAHSVQHLSQTQSNTTFGSPRTAPPKTMAQRQPFQTYAGFSAPPNSNRSPPSSTPNQPSTQNPQSTIAKWGAPASLPPKPPPSAMQSQLPKVNDGSSLPPHPYANGRTNGGSNGVVSNR